MYAALPLHERSLVPPPAPSAGAARLPALGRVGLATLAAIATQPYGVFVLVVERVFVLVRRTLGSDASSPRPRLDRARFARSPSRSGSSTACSPTASTSVSRAPAARSSARPSTCSPTSSRWPATSRVGWTPVVAVVLVVAVVGLVTLAGRARTPALLVAAVILVPTVAFLVTRSGGSVSLESRHVIFALPFFAMPSRPASCGSPARRRGCAVPLVVVPGALLLVGGGRLGVAPHSLDVRRRARRAEGSARPAPPPGSRRRAGPTTSSSATSPSTSTRSRRGRRSER